MRGSDIGVGAEHFDLGPKNSVCVSVPAITRLPCCKIHAVLISDIHLVALTLVDRT